MKYFCDTIDNKQTMFASLAKRRKNIERGRVMMRYGWYEINVSEVFDFELL